MSPRFLPWARLDALISGLTQAGYRCVGPRVEEGAIVYKPLASAEELPRGVHTRQRPGHYRVEHTEGRRRFAWANGPQALRPLTFAPRELLWRMRRDDSGIHFEPGEPPTAPTAVIGVRSCDLAALAIHDRHFGGDKPDAQYLARRRSLFLVAVNCSHPSETCFCASTGDGPSARDGYDLLLDELEEGYIVAAGTPAGEAVLAGLALEPADEARIDAARTQRAEAAQAQTRTLPTGDLNAQLFANLEHPRWEQVAARCLSCANCTLVCPTCFCHGHFENPALDGTHAEHYREWDSCFTEGHSYIHGFTVRADIRKRYRQWLTHKLGGWFEQFGRSGCVGCGRCIAWCPAGIDITEEVRAICGGEA